MSSKRRIQKEASDDLSSSDDESADSDSNSVSVDDNADTDRSANGGVASSSSSSSSSRSSKLTPSQAAVRKRKMTQEAAQALQVTQTHSIPGLLGAVDRKPAAVSTLQSSAIREITRSDVPDGTNTLRVTDTAGDSKDNSRIQLNRDISAPRRSVALQIVLDNVHNCTVTVDCLTGSIQIIQCNSVSVVLKATCTRVELQASHRVSIEVRDAEFPSDGVSHADVSDLRVSIKRDKSDIAVCTVDREEKDDGLQSVIVRTGDGFLARKTVDLKAKQQQLYYAQTEGNSSPRVDTVKKKVRKEGAAHDRIREEVSTTIPVDMKNEDMEKLVGFCCFRCECSEKEKQRIPLDNSFIQSGQNSLYHRRCCHKVFVLNEKTENWRSPIDTAEYKVSRKPWVNDEVAADGVQCSEDEKIISDLDHEKLERNFVKVKGSETEIFNDESQPDPTDLLLTSPHYVENMKVFMNLPERRSAVVLDVFAGIGSGIVSLKRLGIAMKKIIHVEHDKVASHVYRWNHDQSYYGKPSECEIEHIYVDRFEYLEENVGEFMKKHGPIDIAIGGPPCVDYSNVNGRRKGTKGKEGSYMVRFGRLIQEIQQHCHQKGHHLLFMAENVPLENDQNEPLDEGDLELVKAAFGLEWSIDLDAMYFSPARRKRTFLSNIPLDTVQSDYFEERVSISCLKGCYQYVANIKNPTMIVKANCFMASKTKVDDDRMIVLKMDKKSCKQRFMKTHEREDMMGYPTKYVETPVDELFTRLQQDGYGNRLICQAYWKDTLPELYHSFSGMQLFNLEAGRYEVKLQLASPVTGKKRTFFNKEQYAKRLIGNAFSIPVIDILLRSLQTKFAYKGYNNYPYQYAWIPEPVE